MKITRNTSAKTGSALLMVCFISFALAMMLASYLAMTSQENVHVKRSAGWNAALTLAEAGIEEGCSQVNVNSNGYWPDGWVFNTNTFAFNKQRLLGDSYYSVDINGWPGSVVAITSTGYGAWTGSNYLTRIVQVTAQTPVPYIPSGLVANNINFGGSFNADKLRFTQPALQHWRTGPDQAQSHRSRARSDASDHFCHLRKHNYSWLCRSRSGRNSDRLRQFDLCWRLEL